LVLFKNYTGMHAQQNVKFGLDLSFVEIDTFLVPGNKHRTMRNEWSCIFCNVSYKVWDIEDKCHMFHYFWYKNVTYFIHSLNQGAGLQAVLKPFRDITLRIFIFIFIFFLPKEKDLLLAEWNRPLSYHFIVKYVNIYSLPTRTLCLSLKCSDIQNTSSGVSCLLSYC